MQEAVQEMERKGAVLEMAGMAAPTATATTGGRPSQERDLWGPLFSGVVSSQRYLSLKHVVVRVPKSGRCLLRRVWHKKPHEKSFL